jgi:predicted phage terminase large subunit-like protein
MRLKAKGGDGSWTVGQVWGLRDGLFYLVHQVRGMFDLPETIASLTNLRHEYPQAHAILIEDAALGPAVIQMLSHEIPGLIPIPAKVGKFVRVKSRAVSPMIEAGNVLIPNPETTIWVPGFIEECASFSGAAGETNDQVDAMSQALTWMYNKMQQGIQKSHERALADEAGRWTAVEELKGRIAAAVARTSAREIVSANPYAGIRGRR